MARPVLALEGAGAPVVGRQAQVAAVASVLLGMAGGIVLLIP
ncbi:hypothetical protein ABZ297_20945 [Nonomuraea sp. NPDC005983]